MNGQAEGRATFDFYNGYLTVVYGLLVSNGLSYVVKFTSKNPTLSLESVNGLLFLATFLTTLHFWYVCATLDDLSENFYRVLAGDRPSIFELLVLLDIVVATIFAGLLLAMFDAIPGERFFLWLLLAGALSFLYDLYSQGLVLLSQKYRRGERERFTTREYRLRIGTWTKADSAFLTVSCAMYVASAQLRDSVAFALGSIFVVLSSGLLLSDVWSFRSVHRPAQL